MRLSARRSAIARRTDVRLKSYCWVSWSSTGHARTTNSTTVAERRGRTLLSVRGPAPRHHRNGLVDAPGPGGVPLRPVDSGEDRVVVAPADRGEERRGVRVGFERALEVLRRRGQREPAVPSGHFACEYALDELVHALV